MAKLYPADPIETSAKKSKMYPAEEKDTKVNPKTGMPYVPITGEQALEGLQDTAFGAVQGATFNLADEAYGLGKSVLTDSTYEDSRDEARKAWEEARTRSPIGTLVGEVGGSVFSPVGKLLGAGRGLKGIGQGMLEGAIQSYGATSEEGLKEQAIDTAKGTAIGGLTGAISNKLTSGFSKSPEAMSAEVLGVKPKDYRVSGPGDRKKIVSRITDTGMLKNHKMDYNPHTLKFDSVSKGKLSLDEMEKATEERLLGRADDAISKLQERKVKEFGGVLNTKTVSRKELNQMVDDIAKEYSKRGLSKSPLDRIKAAESIGQNIREHLIINGADEALEEVPLSLLDSVKRASQEDVKNFSKSLGDVGDAEELSRITSRHLKNKVEEKIGDSTFNKINSAQHDFLTIQGDLTDKIKGMELATPDYQRYTKPSMIDTALHGFGGGSQGTLNRASMKEMYRGLPKALDPAKAVIPFALEETPGAVMRQKFQGKDIQGNWRNPGSTGNTEMTPMQLAKARLPRSTKGLLENKDLVISKLALNGVPSEIIDTVTQALNDDPESLTALAPMMTMQFPNLFEKSKYNMFDGKILDPNERAKAADDTSKREDIDSIQRAKIISELNKSGKWLGE